MNRAESRPSPDTARGDPPVVGGPVTRRARVHQFAAHLGRFDAVSNHIVALHDLLAGRVGCESDIFAASSSRGRGARARDYHGHGARPPPDLIVHQMCTGSAVAEYVIGRPEPLIIDYHNLTPAKLFRGWEPAIAAELSHGRRQLSRLAPRCRLAIAHSEYSAAEIADLGASEVIVAPVLLDRASLAVPADARGKRCRRAPPLMPARDTPRPDGQTEEEARANRRNRQGAAHAAQNASQTAETEAVWLFVGRLAPHKAQHDLIAAFALYRRLHGGECRLVLAGTGSLSAYEQALRGLAAELGVGAAVLFLGSLSPDELAAWYAAADVFVCLSDHEGFCVPLIEAMHHGLPVVAFSTAAVPETLGNAGLLIEDKTPVTVACAAQRVLDDRQARRNLTAIGRQRAAHLSGPAAVRAYTAAFTALLAGDAGR